MMLTPVRNSELDSPPHPRPLLPGTISILIENVLTTKSATRGDENEGNDQERRSTLKQTHLRGETSL